jgi:hypothetical protein
VRSIENTLSLWEIGALSSEGVVAWADREIARLQNPPYELIELAMYGPKACLARAQADFSPRPAKLTFEQKFALRALATNLQEDESITKLMGWAVRDCMGEDLSSEIVMLCYKVDHLRNDCEDEAAAKQLMRSEVSKLLPKCHELAAPFAEA